MGRQLSWPYRRSICSVYVAEAHREKSGCRMKIATFNVNGAKSPKTKWKLTKAGEDWFCFAGLWRPMGNYQVDVP